MAAFVAGAGVRMSSSSSSRAAAQKGPATGGKEWGEDEGAQAHPPCAYINEGFILDQHDPGCFLSPEMVSQDLFFRCPYEVRMVKTLTEANTVVHRATKEALVFMGWPPEITARVEKNLALMFPLNPADVPRKKYAGPMKVLQAQRLSFFNFIGLLRYQFCVAAALVAIEKRKPALREKPYTAQDIKDNVDEAPGSFRVRVLQEEKGHMAFAHVVVEGMENGDLYGTLRRWEMTKVKTGLLSSELRPAPIDVPVRLAPGWRYGYLSETRIPDHEPIWDHGVKFQLVRRSDDVLCSWNIHIWKLLPRELQKAPVPPNQAHKIKFSAKPEEAK